MQIVCVVFEFLLHIYLYISVFSKIFIQSFWYNQFKSSFNLKKSMYQKFLGKIPTSTFVVYGHTM